MNAGEKTGDPPCRFLQWDSDFFGRRIAAVRGDRLNPEQARSVDAWCRANRIECLYFVCGADDHATIRCAERCGFCLVEVRPIFERFLRDVSSRTRPRPLPENIVIRPASPADLPRFETWRPRVTRRPDFALIDVFPRGRCSAITRHGSHDALKERPTLSFWRRLTVNRPVHCGKHLLRSDPRYFRSGKLRPASPGKRPRL